MQEIGTKTLRHIAYRIASDARNLKYKEITNYSHPDKKIISKYEKIYLTIHNNQKINKNC